jgi:hypothetical protein
MWLSFIPILRLLLLFGAYQSRRQLKFNDVVVE